MSAKPTWFQVARRPKWIGGLFAAMLVAAICALFAQWQAGRSVEAPLKQEQSSAVNIAKAPTIDQVIKPGRTPAGSAVGTLVKTQANLNTAQFWVVGNRVQEDGTNGYWVMGIYSDLVGQKLVAPLGFTASKAQAIAVATKLTGSVVPMVMLPMHGRLSPAEGPDPFQTYGKVKYFDSLSVGQLANLLPTDEATRVYPLFLLVTDSHASGLSNITVTSLNQAQINWLSAFYAIEWTVFCGFSFFMWWRLVRDEQQRERAEAESNLKTKESD